MARGRLGPANTPYPNLGGRKEGRGWLTWGCVWNIHTEREHLVPPFLPPSTFPAGRVALLCGERDGTAGKGSLGAFKIYFQRGAGQAVEAGVLSLVTEPGLCPRSPDEQLPLQALVFSHCV